MRNISPFRGWKKLTGEHGTVSFKDEGIAWAVYEYDAYGYRVYQRLIEKHSRESNKALYERYHLLSIGYSEHDIKEIKRRSK